jgi:hypothetical protein
MSTVAMPAIADPILHGAISLSLTLLADTEDLCRMSYFTETILFRNFIGPLLNGATFDFYSLATALTDQVMMVALTAEAIDSLSIIATEYINNFVIDQAL